MSLIGSIGNTLGLGSAIQGAQGAQNQLAQQQAYNSAYQNQLAMQGIQAGRAVPGAQQSFDPNKEEAYQIPLSQLVTLWQAKYGDKWVDSAVVHDNSFFAHACSRLNANGMFEKAHGWVRLKEGL